MHQRCRIVPTTRQSLREALNDPQVGDGIHLQVTARQFRSSRGGVVVTTVPVRTRANGIVDIDVESGSYRFKVSDSGKVRIRIAESVVTYVEILDSSTVTIDVHGRLNLIARAGDITVNATGTATIALRERHPHLVTVTGQPQHLYRRTLPSLNVSQKIHSAPANLDETVTRLAVADLDRWGMT